MLPAAGLFYVSQSASCISRLPDAPDHRCGDEEAEHRSPDDGTSGKPAQQARKIKEHDAQAYQQESSCESRPVVHQGIGVGRRPPVKRTHPVPAWRCLSHAGTPGAGKVLRIHLKSGEPRVAAEVRHALSA